MNNFDSLFSNPIFQLINFIFAIIGLIASYIQIVNHFTVKKRERVYQTLFSKAETEWQGKYTTAQVDLLKEELSKLQSQIEEENKRINIEIPLRAKEFFIKEQLSSIENNITELYKSSITLKEELKDIRLGPPSNLDKLIEEEIKPNYLRNERQKKIITYSIVFLIAINILPSLYFLLIEQVEEPLTGNETVVIVLIAPLLIFITIFYLTYKYYFKKIINFKVTLKHRIIFYTLLPFFCILFLIATLISYGAMSLHELQNFDLEESPGILFAIILLMITSYPVSICILYFVHNYKKF